MTEPTGTSLPTPHARESSEADAGGASLTALQRRLLQEGTPGRTVMVRLVRRSEEPGFQEGWRDWPRVRDRAELLLRLEVLSRTRRMDPGLRDFVAFFFRSSDPALYQAAALALGRHLPEHPELAEEFRLYLRRRGDPGSGPLPLPGGRSLRRILLVRCRLEDGFDAFPAPGALPLDLARQDLAVLLLGTDRRVRDRGPEALPPVARELVERTAGPPLASGDRALAGRLGDCLVTLDEAGTMDPAWVAARWLGAVEAVAGGAEPCGAGETAARLRCLDELARAHAGLPPEARPSLPPEGAPGAEWLRTDFLPSRARTWAAFLQAGSPPRLEERRRVRRLLGDGLARMGDTAGWLAPPPEDRAWSLVELLDPLLRHLLDPVELSEILGVATVAGEDGGDPLTDRVLARFLACEGARGLPVLDSGLVHRLGASGLTLVLSWNPGPGLVPVLADALEHRFRLGLAVDPLFDPEAFLFRVAAARPSAHFFRAFRELAAGRAYLSPAGEPFPLADWIRRLEEEARREEGAASQESSGDPRPPLGPTARLREELRQALHRIGEEELRDGLLHLASLLGEPREAPGTEEAAHGLISRLLRRLGGGGRDRPGGPVEGLGLSRLAAALTRMAGDLEPVRLEQVRRLRTDLAEFRPSAEELGGRLAGSLPPREGEVLAGSLAQAVEEVEGALRAFTLVEDWSDGGGLPRETEALLERLLGLPDPGVRRAALLLLWREVEAEAGFPAGPEAISTLSAPADWGRAEGALRWAVRSAGRMDAAVLPGWEREVAGGWRAMAGDCMEGGHPRRLSRLLHDPELRPVAAREEHIRFLEELRRWFLDIYRPGDAARALHLKQVAAGGGGALALLRTAPLFVGHYGSVWLALLIGAILMLDFGDAWTAMAEAGDVRGIAYTVALGLAGAFAYVAVDLRRRVRPAPEDSRWGALGGTLLRTSLFLLLCLAYTTLVTSGLWWLLSGTDEVVHGPGAPLHVAVWTGFALFAGVFFGLLAKRAA